MVDLCDGASSDKAGPSRGPSPTGSTALWSLASLPARSHSVTPSHGTSLVRSYSNSVSSTSSHDSASDSPTASNNKDHDSRSTCHEGDGTDDKGTAPKADKQQDNVIVLNSAEVESRKTGSDEEGSASPGCHNSSDSEVEVVTI